ncbi:MAG: hypothetical protein WCI02_18635 [Planctomycetota bacterium]
MQYDTRQCEFNQIFQAVGLSKGWITTHAKDPDHGALGQTIRWAESQFEEIPNASYQNPSVLPTDTLAAIDAGKQKAVQLFSSEAIRVRFPDPSVPKIQGVLRLKRNDRLVNSLPFSEIQPGTSSLHLLEFLRNTNASRTRTLSLPDLVSLAIHSGGSIADFYPDSHVLISNLASFLIRVHVHPGSEASDVRPSGKLLSLRDTWETYGTRFPRVSHRGIETNDEGPLQRQSAMFLYGLSVLQFGPMVPDAPIDREQLQTVVRKMFDRGFTVWPQQLCDFLNHRWRQAIDQQDTLDFWTDEIASIAGRVGQCLLGQFPIASDLLR